MSFQLILEKNQWPDRVEQGENPGFYLKFNEKPLEDFVQESDAHFANFLSYGVEMDFKQMRVGAGCPTERLRSHSVGKWWQLELGSSRAKRSGWIEDPVCR